LIASGNIKVSFTDVLNRAEDGYLQAMILAAGFGTRLLPHTNVKPKPLFPILNQPLLLLTIQRLKRYGFDRIIVNCHHLREQIAESLADIDGVVVQQEEIILGTGGGLRRALSLMRDEPILVTNGDIYHTINYRELYQAHQENNCPVTLGMHDYPRFNTVATSGNRIAGFNKNMDCKVLAFTGLHVVNPAILANIPDGVLSCIVDHYRELLATGESLAVYRTDQCYWTDMGTPEDYLALHEGLLRGSIPLWQEFHNAENGQILIDRDARLSGDFSVEKWCSIGKITGKHVHLSRVVVWDGVMLPDGFTCDNALISSTPQ
jgi:mannose-1-phosphate guanylyltransferase